MIQKKPEATKTLLIAVKTKDKLQSFCKPLRNIEVVEYTNKELRLIVPYELPADVVAFGHCMLAVTDDPTSAEPFEYTSLGHTHLRLTLENARIERFPACTVFIGSTTTWKHALTVPER